MTNTYFITVDKNGYGIGGGASTDGTVPPGFVICNMEQAQDPSSWQVQGNVISAYQRIFTLAEQAHAMLAVGLRIISSSYPALSGIYAVNPAALINIQAVTSYILVNAKFPGSSGTYPWLDSIGHPHLFPDVAEFQYFATAVADFVADLTLIYLTNSGTLPSSTTTIA